MLTRFARQKNNVITGEYRPQRGRCEVKGTQVVGGFTVSKNWFGAQASRPSGRPDLGPAHTLSLRTASHSPGVTTSF